MTNAERPEIHIEPSVEARHGDFVEYTFPKSGKKIRGQIVHEEWQHNIPKELNSEETAALSDGKYSEPPAKALLRLGFFTLNVGTKEEPKYIGGIPAHDAKLVKNKRTEEETLPGLEEVMEKTHYQIGRIGSLENVRMLNANDLGRIVVTQAMIRAIIEEALEKKSSQKKIQSETETTLPSLS